jgi:hypothetical protein
MREGAAAANWVSKHYSIYAMIQISRIILDLIHGLLMCVLAFTIPNSEPDFGFGVNPGRLRGYPLAHLAGTWR